MNEKTKTFSRTVTLPYDDEARTFILQNFKVRDKIVMPCSKMGLIVISYTFDCAEDQYSDFIATYPLPLPKKKDEEDDDNEF